MKEIYVHTLSYRYHGRFNRRSRTMFPVSFGPFQDEDAAREWIRQRGINHATMLMSLPAPENVKISPSQRAGGSNGELAGAISLQTQQSPIP